MLYYIYPSNFTKSGLCDKLIDLFLLSTYCYINNIKLLITIDDWNTFTPSENANIVEHRFHDYKYENISQYFVNDYNAYAGHYCVDLSNNYRPNIIPFNILICQNCKTAQTKYLADINEVYKINHADGTGKCMNKLHNITKDIILNDIIDINNIIEIGSSYGILADLVLEKYNMNYYIIEPSYMGNRHNKIIYDDYYENIDDTEINANTLIISHVFEHFYEPSKILDKIYNNKNINNFLLIFPDLEYYISNAVYHVLNTEHIYYIDNNFIINELSNRGFKLIKKYNHINHSAIFYFKRNNNIRLNNIYINCNYKLDLYYNEIFEKINKYNKIINDNDNVFIWPASIHSIYLCIFGLEYKKMKGFLDNSLNKIGKKIYGYDKMVYSFDKIANNKDDIIILLNGGIFNNELEISKYPKNIKFII